MKQFGLGELDMNGDISKQMIAALERLGEQEGEDSTAYQQLAGTQIEYGKALGELAKANKEVADADKELQKAGEELQKWKESAALMFDSTTEKADETTTAINALSDALSKLNLPFFSIWGGGGKSHAIGSAYIPFDNYPALLHRGEKVLTAAEARQHGTENYGADIGREIREAMGRINVMMSGEKVGNLTTKRVERNIRADNYSKLRAMGG